MLRSWPSSRISGSVAECRTAAARTHRCSTRRVAGLHVGEHAVSPRELAQELHARPALDTTRVQRRARCRRRRRPAPSGRAPRSAARDVAVGLSSNSTTFSSRLSSTLSSCTTTVMWLSSGSAFISKRCATTGPSISGTKSASPTLTSMRTRANGCTKFFDAGPQAGVVGRDLQIQLSLRRHADGLIDADLRQ